MRGDWRGNAVREISLSGVGGVGNRQDDAVFEATTLELGKPLIQQPRAILPTQCLCTRRPLSII